MGFVLLYILDPKEQKTKELWWSTGVVLFSEVSSWIVGPIVLALILGKILDNHFDTKPVIFLVLTGFSFIISCFGIYKIVKRYIENIKEEVSNKNTENK